jgi:hypothetical protein
MVLFPHYITESKLTTTIITKLQDHESKSSNMKTIHHEHHREQALPLQFLLDILRKLRDHQNKSSDVKTIHHEHHREPASHYNSCSTLQSSMITKPEAAT